MSRRQAPTSVPSHQTVLALRVQLMAAESTARIGERIKDLREQRGITQAALARALPGVVEASAVSRWERGKVRPRDETMEKLAEVLGVDFSYFVAPEPAGGSAPDLMSRFSDDDMRGLAERVDRVEQKIDRVLALLTPPEAVAGPLPPERVTTALPRGSDSAKRPQRRRAG